MWPLAVVVVDVDAKDMLEVAAVENQQPVEALRADGADEAFGDRIRLRRSHRRLRNPDTFVRKTSSKGPLYLLSRSRIKKRTPLSLKSKPRFRACWVTTPQSDSSCSPRARRAGSRVR